MNTKSNRFDVEWWIISKRVIYVLVASLIVAIAASGIGVYSWVYGNPFKSGATEILAPAGARFVSFDGDVRVVRAQTRETLLARSDTQLYPGDIVQTQADGRARIQLADGSNLIVRPNSVVTSAITRVSRAARAQTSALPSRAGRSTSAPSSGPKAAVTSSKRL